MNSVCPSCESILRNPRHCSCGWSLNADVPLVIRPRHTTVEQQLRNQENSKRLIEYVRNLNKREYEPGADE